MKNIGVMVAEFSRAGPSKVPMMRGMIDLLSRINVGSNIIIYIKNRDFIKSTRPFNGKMESIIDLINFIDGMIKDSWRTLSEKEFALYKLFDSEMKKHLYSGSCVDFRLLRPIRCVGISPYDKCLKWIDSKN